MGFLKKLKPGKYTNRKDKHYTVHSDGSMSVDIDKFLNLPEVRRQLEGMNNLFRQQTIMALRLGTEPPHMVGKETYTKKSLLQDWDDDWQAALEECNKHVDITYNSFFDIPEEHPPVTEFLTADEIVRQYGKT
ncbi:MAG: hypothetical protein V3R41_04470 [Gammaproteobacteria bacterium]